MKDISHLRSEWVRDLITVLREHPGGPTFWNLYQYLEKYRKAQGRSWGRTAESTMRMTLQRHCRLCPQYQGKLDVFEKLVNGCWQLTPEWR